LAGSRKATSYHPPWSTKAPIIFPSPKKISLDGGWEQAPLETYDEQYYSENTRLLFIKIDVRSSEFGPIVEEIFSKTVVPHDMQMHFEIVVQPDKTVTYAAH
jgi:hypothetical protein